MLLSAALAVPCLAQDEEWRRRRAPADPRTTAKPEPAPETSTPKVHSTETTAFKIEGEVQTVTFELPPNFVPASIPPRALDKQLRVALLLPVFDEVSSARGYIWNDFQKTSARPIVLNSAQPISVALPRIIARLFPQTRVVTSLPPPADPPQFDLILKMTLLSGVREPPFSKFGGVYITGTITAMDAGGKSIATIVANGLADFTKSLYWSVKGRAKVVGIPAAQNMLNNLVRELLADPALLAHLREHAAARERPSELEATLAFDDSTGFFPNGRLDAGEKAELVFKLRNRGAGAAFDVRLRMTPPAHLTFPVETVVGDLPPGGEKEIRVEIAADLRVETFVPRLPVEIVEKRGYGGSVVAEIATARLVPPTLEVVDFRLSDRGGSSAGDGDGRVSNGETVEAIVLVRNGGPGASIGGTLTVAGGAAGVEIPEPVVPVPSIAVNAVAEVRFIVRLAVTYPAGALPLSVRVVETRGAFVAQTVREESWDVDMKRPALEVTYRLYDGNSAGSSGDRDGVANNGETVELVLLPANRGPLKARDVELALSSAQAGLIFSREQFTVGDLPAHSEGAEQRVLVQLPRTMGRDAILDKLPLAVTVKQRDFSPREEAIVLSFAVRRPDVVASIVAASPLRAGESATLWLEVENRGELPAEGVQVELSSEPAGLELLDALGAPTRKLRVEIGSIAARTLLPRREVKAHVKRNVAATEALIRMMCLQNEFPSVGAQATLRIRKEPVAVVSVVPPPVAEPVLVRSAPPANISFRRFDDGDRVAQEMVMLRFEVQSHRDPATVRLEHNGHAVELGRPARLPGEGNHAWQYEQQIRLAYGVNEIAVVAVTPEGIRSTRTLSLFRERREGKVWVAVIGVSQYGDDAIPDLDFATDDASAVADYYRDLFDLPDEQMIVLLDERATLANIKRQLGTELVAKAVNPHDTVILYFAGHGKKEVDPGSPDSDGFSKYLLPYDTDLTNLFGSALSMEELTRILHRLRPDRVALILDSCFSGAAGGGGRTLFDQGENTRSARLTEEFLFRMASAGKGRVILTASSANELARERADLGHGIFTYFLLQGLRGEADQDADGRIDVDEIYKFTSQKVVAATRGQQNPMKKAPSMTGTVILGKTSLRRE